MRSFPVTGVLLLAAMVALVEGQSTAVVATRPTFTVGKDTTLVDGPLNADGTVNYIWAINALLSKGITTENNAAIPLLKANANYESQRQKLAEICAELGIPVPAKEEGLFQMLIVFAREKNKGKDGEALALEVEGWEKAMASGPWKGAEMPVAEAWIKSTDKGYGLIEEACGRDRFYLPLVSAKSPPTFTDALPPMTFLWEAGKMLTARGMLRAGSGDFGGALKDFRRERVLARLAVQQHEMIFHLIGNAMEREAMRNYVGLVTKGRLTAAQLLQVTREIVSLPPFPEVDAMTDSVEELVTLDMVMQCIRGDVDKSMRIMAGEFDESKRVDLGDLSKVDWDVLMKELHRTNAEVTAADRDLTFMQKMAAHDARTKLAAADKQPGEGFFGGVQQPTGIPALETYLKMRPGETREAFSKRIGHWLGESDPEASKRFLMIIERCHVERGLALLAVSLAEYHLAHGEYPVALKDMGGEGVLADPFSGKEVVYRRDGKGYVVYSFGLNFKDDGGAEDDIAVKGDE